MQFKLRPDFGTVIQYFLLPQSDGKVCLLKHVKGAYIQTLLQGNGYELHWDVELGWSQQEACQEGISMASRAASVVKFIATP